MAHASHPPLLAMIHVARPGQKKVAIGILSAAGLTAFLTGVTEPLEFAFMFVAFPLYVIHALLTGLSLAIAHALDIHLGFSFSAGLIDLLLYGTAPAILIADKVGVLVHLGLDTPCSSRVRASPCMQPRATTSCRGNGSSPTTCLPSKPPAATPIILVVVLDTKASALDDLAAPGTDVSTDAALFTVTR